jgi:hypothetical protein
MISKTCQLSYLDKFNFEKFSHLFLTSSLDDVNNRVKPFELVLQYSNEAGTCVVMG